MRLIEKSPRELAEHLFGKGLPIPESIIPLDSRGKRDWSKLRDDELVAHAKWEMSDEGVSGRKELCISNSGLYSALVRRENRHPGIMDRVGFARIRRKWEDKSDDEFVAFIQGFMREMGKSGRHELELADPGLYQALVKREKKRPGIMERIGFDRKKRQDNDWRSKDDDELVCFALDFKMENRIETKKQLEKAFQGLYSVLWKRGLIDRVFPGAKEERLGQAIDDIIDALGTFNEEK